jgi:hypothetical protein
VSPSASTWCWVATFTTPGAHPDDRTGLVFRIVVDIGAVAVHRRADSGSRTGDLYALAGLGMAATVALISGLRLQQLLAAQPNDAKRLLILKG